jgi:citrate synthase
VLTNHPVVSGASAESSWKRLPLSLRLGHAASNGREPSRRRETHWRTKVEAAAALEQAALSELRDRRPDRAIETNVEFWAAVILEFAEVPAYMMPAMFTCARTAGWSAHILEQKRLGKLVRPAALYAGPDARTPDTVEGWKENLGEA